jgi:hypothetical protein
MFLRGKRGRRLKRMSLERMSARYGSGMRGWRQQQVDQRDDHRCP